MPAKVTRLQSIGLIGSAFLLPSCASRLANAVRVASTSAGENITVAEIYAVALERSGIPVERHTDLGTEHDVESALQRGEIDLYPAHVRSGDAEQKVHGITRLNASPAIEGPCLATSQYSAEQYWLLTLSECSAIASQLRLAATREFAAAGGPLDHLRKAYGGFNFKTVVLCEPDAQYYAVGRGDADVANAFTTDAIIVENQLIVLADDKLVLPSTRIAPVISDRAIRIHPHAGSVLNHISAKVTQYALREMNRRRNLLDMDAHDVAQAFVDANTPHTARRRS